MSLHVYYLVKLEVLVGICVIIGL